MTCHMNECVSKCGLYLVIEKLWNKYYYIIDLTLSETLTCIWPKVVVCILGHSSHPSPSCQSALHHTLHQAQHVSYHRMPSSQLSIVIQNILIILIKIIHFQFDIIGNMAKLVFKDYLLLKCTKGPSIWDRWLTVLNIYYKFRLLQRLI